MMLAMAANLKGAFDGFCCRAKIRPPMLGPSSLAAMRLREGPAGRRRAMRRRGGGVGGLGVGRRRSSRSAFRRPAARAAALGRRRRAVESGGRLAGSGGGSELPRRGACSNGGSLAASSDVGARRRCLRSAATGVGSGRASPSCASSLLLSCAIAPSMPDASPVQSFKSTRPNGKVVSKSERRVASPTRPTSTPAVRNANPPVSQRLAGVWGKRKVRQPSPRGVRACELVEG